MGLFGTVILQNIFCAWQKEESHAGFERHEVMKELAFLDELWRTMKHVKVQFFIEVNLLYF